MISYNLLSKIYISSKLEIPSIFSGFTTRAAGDGRVTENILSYLRINQTIFSSIVVAEQIHSANIVFFESSDASTVIKIPETDGLVTKEKKIALVVRTADCIPVLYADKFAGIIGVSHNGWRGTLKKISVRMIEAMESKGAKKENIVVAIGPGIGACCYDIDDDRYYNFMEELDNDFGAFSIRHGKKHLNLIKLNYEILKQTGVKPENIDYFPFCTSCNKEKFFSYRRDHKKHPEKFGEMFSYIVRN